MRGISLDSPEFSKGKQAFLRPLISQEKEGNIIIFINNFFNFRCLFKQSGNLSLFPNGIQPTIQ